MRKGLVLGILMVSALLFGIAEAVQTKLVIRAKSKDAKFIGSKTGGAMVVIKDSETGRVLAKGLTTGATGNTQKIVIEPKTRFGRIADGAAKFETSIDINEPSLITIDVEAPLVTKPNMIKSSTQMWLIPGKHVVGEGVVIEVPGFSVDVDTPENVNFAGNKTVIPIQARIEMI